LVKIYQLEVTARRVLSTASKNSLYSDCIYMEDIKYWMAHFMISIQSVYKKLSMYFNGLK